MTGEECSNEEIRALCDAATPGPWEMQPSGVILGPPRNRESLAAWVVSLVDLIHDADAEFIVAARTIVPSLLSRLAAVEAWAMKNEIAAPPLDWAGLDAILHPVASPTPITTEEQQTEVDRAMLTPTGAEHEHDWDFQRPGRPTCRRCGCDYRSASPTPTGPEPAKCERDAVFDLCDCEVPGPATPEPTEETP